MNKEELKEKSTEMKGILLLQGTNEIKKQLDQYTDKQIVNSKCRRLKLKVTII